MRLRAVPAPRYVAQLRSRQSVVSEEAVSESAGCNELRLLVEASRAAVGDGGAREGIRTPGSCAMTVSRDVGCAWSGLLIEAFFRGRP
jgi:hypothetical protein